MHALTGAGISSEVGFTSPEFFRRLSLEKYSIVVLPTLNPELDKTENKTKFKVAYVRSVDSYLIFRRCSALPASSLKDLEPVCDQVLAAGCSTVLSVSCRRVSPALDLVETAAQRRLLHGYIEIDFSDLAASRVPNKADAIIEICRTFRESVQKMNVQVLAKIPVLNLINEIGYLYAELCRNSISVVFSLHPVVKTNGDVTCIHSPEVELTSLLALASALGEATGSYGVVGGVATHKYTSMLGMRHRFVLYDFTEPLKEIIFNAKIERGRLTPIRWPDIPESITIVSDLVKNNISEISRLCPLGALTVEGGFIVANNHCEKCGLCIELFPDVFKMGRLLSP